MHQLRTELSMRCLSYKTDKVATVAMTDCVTGHLGLSGNGVGAVRVLLQTLMIIIRCWWQQTARPSLARPAHEWIDVRAAASRFDASNESDSLRRRAFAATSLGSISGATASRPVRK